MGYKYGNLLWEYQWEIMNIYPLVNSQFAMEDHYLE